MLVYVVIYLLSFSGYIFNANNSKKNKRNYLLFIFSVLVLVASIRDYTVGTDLYYYYSKYYPEFGSTPWSDIQNVTLRNGEWEVGFCALCKILAGISPDVQFFIFVTSVITVVPFGIFIYRNSKDVVFSTSVYIGFCIYAQSFNIIRQMIACGIVVLGLELLKRGRYVLYILIVLFATLFHQTAIIALILVIFDIIHLNRNKIMIILFSLLVFFALFNSIISSLVGNFSFLSEYKEYAEGGNRDTAGYFTIHTISMFAILLIFFIICFVLIDNKNKEHIPKEIAAERLKVSYSNKGMLILWKKTKTLSYWSDYTILVGLLFATVFRFSAFFLNVTSRFSVYFFPFMLIAIPHACEKISDNKQKKIIYFVIYFIITIFYFYITAEKAQWLWRTTPYKTFF